MLDFIEALAALRARAVPVAATVSGIGPDLDASRDRAVTLGLDAPALRFTGYADYDAVPAIYRDADIFVSPTYAEGFSNTILEAMASGLANMSCVAVGVSDCLRNGENGLLVQPGDIAGLTDGLQRLIEDQALRCRIARAGLDECRRVYSWTAVGRQIMDVYAQVVTDVARRASGSSVDPHLPMTPCRFRIEPHLL